MTDVNPMRPSPGDLELADPCRPPWWRFELASEIAFEGRVLGPADDDQSTRNLADFLTYEWSSPGVAELEELKRRRPAIASAVEIWREARRTIAAELEAHLLTPHSYKGIAERMKLSQYTVEQYERLFFDFGDLIDNVPYVIEHAVRHEFRHGLDAATAEQAATVKLIAYYSGPDALDALRGGELSDPGEIWLRASDVMKQAGEMKNLRALVKSFLTEPAVCPRGHREQAAFFDRVLTEIANGRMQNTGTHICSRRREIRIPRPKRGRSARCVGETTLSTQSPLRVDEHRSRLLDAVVRLAAPCCLAGEATLAADSHSGCFRGPADAYAAAKELRAQFSSEALLDAGVCIPGDDVHLHQIQLAPHLVDSPFVALRLNDRGATDAIFTPAVAHPKHASLGYLLADTGTRSLLENSNGFLFAVPKDSVATFRALGLPAMPWTPATSRLQKYTRQFGNALRRLASAPITAAAGPNGATEPSQPGFEPAAAASGVATEARTVGTRQLPMPMLVLAGWRLEGWSDDYQQELADAVAFFTSIQLSYPFWPVRVGVWLPSDLQRAKMLGAIKYGDIIGFRAALLSSVRLNLFSLARASGLNLTAPLPPATIDQARQELSIAISYLGPHSRLTARCQDDYQRLIFRTADSAQFWPEARPEAELVNRAMGDRLAALASESPHYRAELTKCLLDPHRDQTRLAAMERRGQRIIKDVFALSSICRQLASPTNRNANERPKLA